MEDAFVRTSELPDIFSHTTTKVYQKGHKSYFFRKKILSGSSEILFLAREIPVEERNYGFSDIYRVCNNFAIVNFR